MQHGKVVYENMHLLCYDNASQQGTQRHKVEMKLDATLEALNKRARIAPNGEEYWMGRDIQEVLAYTSWQAFEGVINKAKMSCDSSGVTSDYHFIHTSKVVKSGTGAQIERGDYFLTRYACYLIAMNGDSSKPEIATAQTYFAIQTRRQEIQEQLPSSAKRIELRERVKTANKSLFGTAQKAGVLKFGPFNDAGYRGLYGMGLPDIKCKKQIPHGENLLDCAGRVELAANEFRITQTEQKLKLENIQGEESAIRTHKHVGEEVRATIKKLGGTMPEDLPKEPSIKKLLLAQRKAKKLPSGSE